MSTKALTRSAIEYMFNIHQFAIKMTQHSFEIHSIYTKTTLPYNLPYDSMPATDTVGQFKRASENVSVWD